MEVARLARQIEYLETTLDFTKSQLADALRVERAALHQWTHGVQPDGKTGQRLEQLRQFAARWGQTGLGSARAAWYFRTANSERALGALLMQDPLDLEKLYAYIQEAQQAPQTMELAETNPIIGFDADSRSEERRRKQEFFPPSFSNNE